MQKQEVRSPDEKSQHIYSRGFIDNYYQWDCLSKQNVISSALLNDSGQHEQCSSLLVSGNTIWFDDMLDNAAMTHPNGYGNIDKMVYYGFGCQPNVLAQGEPTMNTDCLEPPN